MDLGILNLIFCRWTTGSRRCEGNLQREGNRFLLNV